MFACLAQLLIGFDEQAAGYGGESDEQIVEELAGGRGHGLPTNQLDRCRQDCEEDQRRNGTSPGKGGPGHDDGVQEEAAVLGRRSKREHGQDQRRRNDGGHQIAAIGATDDSGPEPCPDRCEREQKQKTVGARLGAEAVGQEGAERIDKKGKPGHHEKAA